MTHNGLICNKSSYGGFSDALFDCRNSKESVAAAEENVGGNPFLHQKFLAMKRNKLKAKLSKYKCLS